MEGLPNHAQSISFVCCQTIWLLHIKIQRVKGEILRDKPTQFTVIWCEDQGLLSDNIKINSISKITFILKYQFNFINCEWQTFYQ